MTTRTSPITSQGRTGMRRAGNPSAWHWPRITFISTCPKCGQERNQHGYTRHILLDLLNTRRKIDAYCIVCNVCWPIKESERRAISLP